MIATANSWKILPMPETKAPIPFSAHYSIDEFKKIRKGFIPKDMDDRWFIYFDDPWLYFHRSWSGIGMFQIRFSIEKEKVTVSEAWRTGNGDPTKYNLSDKTGDKERISTLISNLLLGRERKKHS